MRSFILFVLGWQVTRFLCCLYELSRGAKVERDGFDLAFACFMAALTCAWALLVLR
jgi:hypothetical protein